MEDEKINSEAMITALVGSKPIKRKSEELESLKRISTETAVPDCLNSVMTAVEKCESGTKEICEPVAVSVEKCESVTKEDTKRSRQTETEDTEAETRKRIMEEEFQPVLTRLPSEGPSCGSNCIRIHKNQVLVN